MSISPAHAARLLLLGLLAASRLHAQDGRAFEPAPLAWVAGPLDLAGPARPGGYLAVAGRRAAAFGTETGTLEVWTWPLKLLHGFELAFQTPLYADPVPGSDVARWVEVSPAGATIVYAHPAFTVRERLFAPVNEPAVAIVLEVEAVRPMEIIARFRSDLALAWPGGLGGQYIFWNDRERAFVLSESRRQVNAMVGSPFATSATTHPAHALPEAPSEIRIAVGDQRPVPMPRPGEPAGRLVNVRSAGIPIVFVGAIEPRDSVLATYRRVLARLPELYAERVAHQDSLLGAILGADEPALDRALRWAEINLDEAMVCNPDLGCSLVAGYGPAGAGGRRPGFGWFFGGDAAINSLALASVGAFDLAREALRFFARYQRADGKIAHEISQSAARLRWFEDYPYAFYHGDTTPFWILAVGELFRASGDTTDVRGLWPNLLKAYRWCLTTDSDGDGLMENPLAGAGAIEVGDLGVGVKSDVYLAAVWVEALRRLEEMAAAVGDRPTARDAARRFETARGALAERFWMPAVGRFAFAVLEGDRLNENLTVWPATAMSFGLFDERRGQLMAVELARATISTDWGGRALAALSPLYDPLHYNNGTVWPFVTGFLALAQYRYHNPYAGDEQLEAILRTAEIWGLGRNPEVFSGSAFEPLDTAVPQQFFATSMLVTALVRGRLGLEADAPRGRLVVAPHLFAAGGSLTLSNVRVGRVALQLTLQQSDTAFEASARRLSGRDPLVLAFDPALAPGARVREVEAGGRPVRAETTSTGRDVHVRFEVPLTDSVRVVIRHDPGWRLLPPRRPVLRGARSANLKVLDARWDADAFSVVVEVRAGLRYELGLRSPALAAGAGGPGEPASRVAVEGALMRAADDGQPVILLEVPAGEGDPREGYARQVLRIRAVP